MHDAVESTVAGAVLFDPAQATYCAYPDCEILIRYGEHGRAMQVYCSRHSNYADRLYARFCSEQA